MKDLRTFLDEYEESHPDLVVHVEQEVDARWEASAIVLKSQKELPEAPVFVFHRLRTVHGEISPFPVVMNLFASRHRLAHAVDSSFERVGIEIWERRARKVPPVTVSRDEAPVKEVVHRDARVLRELPAVVHAAWDPGPYLSAGFLTTYDPETGIDNCALQRGWIYDDHEIRIFPNSASHNWWNIRKVEEQGGDARVAFWVGHHPAVYMGAESKLGYPESHWANAGGLAAEPIRLVPSETLGEDFLVPADAEFVIEGIVPRGQRKPEGPFGEYTRYFGGQRLNPCMEVTCVTHRKDPQWVSIVTGYGDDMIGGLRREGFLYETMKRIVPQVINIYRPTVCPFHMYVQLRKTADWQPRSIIMAALSVPEGIKHVFVFDEDVDIFDENEVQWAIGTRADWAKDLIVVEDLHTSGLDPTSTGHGLGTRAGIDCTKPAPPGVYEQRSFIPAEVMERIRLADYLSSQPVAARK